MCACVHACVYACACVHGCVCVCACVGVWVGEGVYVCACVHVCMYTRGCTQACMCTHACIELGTGPILVHPCTHICMCMYVYACMYRACTGAILVQRRDDMCMYACMYACTGPVLVQPSEDKLRLLFGGVDEAHRARPFDELLERERAVAVGVEGTEVLEDRLAAAAEAHL